MTDYSEFREANRDPAFIRTPDPLATRWSGTRNSHYSHGSVSASTRSWVYSAQHNPPPPPEPIPISSSPVRTLRPLPDPQLQPQYQHPTYYITNAAEEEEEEEYMNIDPNADGVDIGYRTEGLGRGKLGRTISPRPDVIGSSSRSFVGGFVRGLRKLPKVVLGYGGSGEKRKFFRRGTLGTEGTATSVATGNTLPRYTSNPSTPLAGPFNTQDFQGGQMSTPPATSPLPPAVYETPNSQRRRHPSFRVTPPSEVIEQEETELEYVSEQHTPQFPIPSVVDPQDGERTTVLVYQDPQPDGLAPPSRPASTPLRRSDSAPLRRSDSTTIRLPDPTPILRSNSHRQPSDTAAAAEANQVTSPVQSPVLAHPHPTSDYRKMGESLLSPTSPTTLTTTTFTSEPSFSSELHPVKRFFTTLYHMPWIARDRVTVDYRPGGSRAARRAAVKKPMASWYKGKPGVVTSAKAGSGSLDLLSAGSESRRESTTTGATGATGATPIASPVTASPVTERVKPRSSDRHRHHKRDRHHRRDRDRRRDRRSRRRDTFSTAATMDIQHIRSTSPIVPTVYPYPYAYPYAAYPSFPTPHPLEPSYSQSTPRGPRSHRQQTFTHGYVPFQPPPPPPPPPMYVIHSSAQTQGSGSGAGDTSLGQSSNQGQMVSPVYMQMQLVPGSFNAEGVGSPPSSPDTKPVTPHAT